MGEPPYGAEPPPQAPPQSAAKPRQQAQAPEPPYDPETGEVYDEPSYETDWNAGPPPGNGGPKANGTAHTAAPDKDKEWLKRLGMAFAGCSTAQEFTDAQRNLMANWKGKVRKETWAEAVKMAEKVYQRFNKY
jgi:hypothetical protein